MNQLNFDFGKNVNERIYTAEESLMINEIVADYKVNRFKLKDEIIITQIFFEEHFLEIAKRLKFIGFFEGEWNLEENSFGWILRNFINDEAVLNNSFLTEFIMLLIRKLGGRVKPLDWQNNSTTDFAFDRKVTEGILDNICNGTMQNAILPLIGYIKIWNHFKIYNNPFNNYKGILIHRIFAERIWPKDKISYEMYSNFEKAILDIIANIKSEITYVPFFDKKEKDYYSNIYVKERNKLKQNIENLFDFDLTDVYEPYHSLIEDLINNPLDYHKRDLIRKKVEEQLHPNSRDIKMFRILYENSREKQFGKWLLSKFYLYNLLDY